MTDAYVRERGGDCSVPGTSHLGSSETCRRFKPGQPSLAAQHPSLGVELAGQCPQGADGTPVGPSRVLGCPRPRASRDAVAARRGRTYTCTLHVHLSIHDRDGLRYPRFI